MKEFVTSLRLCVVSLAVCCVGYPLIVLAFARTTQPAASEGSLVRDDYGRVVGSRLIAQEFRQPHYFWPRPSAVNYDASAAGGSNLSPTSGKLTERALVSVASLQSDDHMPVPADLVAASGSGLDPHITLRAAEFQIPRIARTRRMSEDAIHAMIQQHTDSSIGMVSGSKPLVNVLELNLALDRLSPLSQPE